MNEVSETSAQDDMIQRQIRDRGVRDERVLAAMRAVRRDRFFPEPIRDAAFDDRAAPIGHGQTISQPYIVALMTASLELHDDHRVLEIGTGSGYQTAILAKLSRDVYTIERVKPLLDEAFERLLAMGIRNVHYRFGDGTLGWTREAPFDRIVITAGAPALPERLLMAHLVEGGLAVLPVGPENGQMLVAARRHGQNLDVEDICPCRFVKLIGSEGWAQ